MDLNVGCKFLGPSLIFFLREGTKLDDDEEIERVHKFFGFDSSLNNPNYLI